MSRLSSITGNLLVALVCSLDEGNGAIVPRWQRVDRFGNETLRPLLKQSSRLIGKARQFPLYPGPDKRFSASILAASAAQIGAPIQSAGKADRILRLRRNPCSSFFSQIPSVFMRRAIIATSH
jgi:hypothetical protein